MFLVTTSGEFCSASATAASSSCPWNGLVKTRGLLPPKGGNRVSAPGKAVMRMVGNPGRAACTSRISPEPPQRGFLRKDRRAEQATRPRSAARPRDRARSQPLVPCRKARRRRREGDARARGARVHAPPWRALPNPALRPARAARSRYTERFSASREASAPWFSRLMRAPATTCRLVRMTPRSTMTTPVPVLPAALTRTIDERTAW